MATIAQLAGLVTYTEVSSIQWSAHSTAPNGSSSATDHYTLVISRQDWAPVEENDIYAGRSYRVTDLYISHDPDVRGQRINSSSRPWTALVDQDGTESIQVVTADELTAGDRILRSGQIETVHDVHEVTGQLGLGPAYLLDLEHEVLPVARRDQLTRIVSPVPVGV